MRVNIFSLISVAKSMTTNPESINLDCVSPDGFLELSQISKNWDKQAWTNSTDQVQTAP